MGFVVKWRGVVGIEKIGPVIDGQVVSVREIIGLFHLLFEPLHLSLEVGILGCTSLFDFGGCMK